MTGGAGAPLQDPAGHETVADEAAETREPAEAAQLRAARHSSEECEPSAAPAAPLRDPQAGVTRRQFVVGGGVLVVAAAVAAGFVGWQSWTVRDRWYRLGLGGPLAIMGWSMGAYGALRAAEVRPTEFTCVCAVSAALWRSHDDGVGDAFDSAADYAANDVFADAGELGDVPVRLDCGRQDPFYAADKAFVEALPQPPAGGFSPGGHNDAFWGRVAPAEIDWIGGQLGRTFA